MPTALVQSRAAKSFQVEFPRAAKSSRMTLILRDRDTFGDPSKRDVGLRPAQLLERGFGECDLASHNRCRDQYAVDTDEVGALTDRFAREPHRLVIVASEKLGTSGEISDDRGVRITGALSECAAGCDDAILAASGPGQHLTIIGPRQREVRIEGERLFELG